MAANGNEIAKENQRVLTSGTIGLDRHKQVLATYRAVAREAVQRCDMGVAPGATHSMLVEQLVGEIVRLRNEVAAAAIIQQRITEGTNAARQSTE